PALNCIDETLVTRALPIRVDRSFDRSRDRWMVLPFGAAGVRAHAAGAGAPCPDDALARRLAVSVAYRWQVRSVRAGSTRHRSSVLASSHGELPESAIPPPREAPMITLEGIRQAHTRIRGMVRCTPLYRSASLSEQCGMEILLKHEYQQITGSFKERGACNTLLGLDAEARRRGVVAASAGNHALGLAFHGQRLGIPVCVVMPRFAPLVKVHRCRALGARVLLVGSSFDDARSTALTIARDEGRTLVHGFDHPAIMEGQGTLGLELLEQEPDLDAIVVPVGGGGLLAGVATAVKSQRPEVAIIGVEAERAPTLTSALAHGGPTRVRVGAGLADGLAVAELGGQCFATLHDKIDGAEVVSEAEIAGAIVTL